MFLRRLSYTNRAAHTHNDVDPVSVAQPKATELRATENGRREGGERLGLMPASQRGRCGTERRCS
jgi:hypothetical protein